MLLTSCNSNSKPPVIPDVIDVNYPSADLTRDGFVDFRDFAVMASQWTGRDPCSSDELLDLIIDMNDVNSVTFNGKKFCRNQIKDYLGLDNKISDIIECQFIQDVNDSNNNRWIPYRRQR